MWKTPACINCQQNSISFKANYMFLRATNGWISHGPKDMEDLAFEFHKATSGTSFRRPRL